MKKLILISLLMLSSVFCSAQQFWAFELGLSEGQDSTIVMNISPNFDVNTDPNVPFWIFTSTMTVRWITQSGVSLDASTAVLCDTSWASIINIWGIWPNPLVMDGIYSYQTFTTSGEFDSNIQMYAGQVYPFIKVRYHTPSSCVKFQVMDDMFQELNNISWWCSIIDPLPPQNSPDVTYPTFYPNRFIIGMESVLVGCPTANEEVNAVDWMRTHSNSKFTLLDMSGSLVASGLIKELKLRSNDIPSGVYLIKTGSYVFKFMKIQH